MNYSTIYYSIIKIIKKGYNIMNINIFIILSVIMKVCLINPPSYFINPPWLNNTDFVHLGLGYIASVLESSGYETNIIECDIQNIDILNAALYVQMGNYKFVGLSIYSYNYLSAIKIANEIKKYSKDIFIFAGGYYPTIHYEQLLSLTKSIDFCIIGDGELTIRDLITTIEQHQSIEHIRGLAYRKHNEIIITKLREIINDIDIYPFPNRVYISKKNGASIISSRGCYESCIFCSLPQYMYQCNGNILRLRSAKNIIAELKYLVINKHVKRFSFVDNNLIAVRENGKQWISDFVDEIRQECLQISFNTYARPKDIVEYQKNYEI